MRNRMPNVCTEEQPGSSRADRGGHLAQAGESEQPSPEWAAT